MLKAGEVGSGADSQFNNLDDVDYGNLFSFCYGPDRDLEAVETQDNIPGGVYRTEKFLRYIEPRGDDNIVLQYKVKINEDSLRNLYFFVSSQATIDDLALYDFIADSIQLVE